MSRLKHTAPALTPRNPSFLRPHLPSHLPPQYKSPAHSSSFVILCHHNQLQNHEAPLRLAALLSSPDLHLHGACPRQASILREQVQGEVREGEGEGEVRQVLQHLLRRVQVRALRHLRQQAPVPLLPRQEELQGQAQMPLKLLDS